MKTSLADLRKEYTLATLDKKELHPDPIEQFQRWFQQALQAKLIEPHAMTLATAGKSGWPNARVVLLKGVDARGFVYFTNYRSRKGRELAENPRAALVLYWPELERQVRILGRVKKVSRGESAIYFRSRPRASQLAAWISEQSQVIASRAVLEERFARLAQKFPRGPVALPPFWGGYVLAPVEIEFWQGRASRLHDRLRYRKLSNGRWRIERLAP